MHTITREEHDAINAGLRLLQEAILRRGLPSMIDDIATNAGNHPVLTPDQIDVLCETINTNDYQHV